jgi:hypothetical protein
MEGLVREPKESDRLQTDMNQPFKNIVSLDEVL